jgi:hypothetical protein
MAIILPMMELACFSKTFYAYPPEYTIVARPRGPHNMNLHHREILNSNNIYPECTTEME